ncbi:hypothetical protein DID96_10370 [Burkholderia sp. Bp8963]|uniref:DUF6708 domain-containing protein n=1 Tax=Burkholderia sp. Bp8963 TaxID=2184547 RepID=UPI000F594874|nr:DUF6708 domain-containing protein [Burkholderia sp. Bp8963]RQS72618.1 hypothetical protein DID96_10370 [Burkholderia sp. Bp8963]
MKHTPGTLRRLPTSLLIGATRLRRGVLNRHAILSMPDLLRQAFGVRRVNAQCVELELQGNILRNVYASGIGVVAIACLGISALGLYVVDARMTWRLVTYPIGMSVLAVFVAGVIYLLTRSFSGRFRGSFVRLHRGTRKLYVVSPYDQHFTELDWDALQAFAGYVPVVSAAGYSDLYPLYLIGIDTHRTPPHEICVSCGNMGWRDQGASAQQLWDYLQIFMDEGADALTKPPPVPPRLSRKHTFLRCYRDWAAKFRTDLPTAKDGLRKPWLVLGKLIWLVCMVFPDSLAEVIEYNVPYARFPDEIDALCGLADEDAADQPRVEA